MYSNVAGKHEKHVSLQYKPIDWNAVCCSADYIFVVSNYLPAVHVYSWTGHHIQTLSHQQLGARKNHYIHTIQCNNDGTVLQLAMGGHSDVRFLRAYKERCSLILSYRSTSNYILDKLIGRFLFRCIKSIIQRQCQQQRGSI